MLAYLVEAAGWASAAASLYAFNCKTIIPLRIAIIVANVLAIGYASVHLTLPNIALNLVLLPLNIHRLREMQRLIKDVKLANKAELDFDWLKPFMQGMDVKAGDTLFQRGDAADAAYVVANGQVSLPDLGVLLGPGSMFGEMGLFAKTNKRMSTARMTSDGRLYRISYDNFEQLYFQNPQFGLYLVRLMVRRMESNLARVSGPRPQVAPRVEGNLPQSG